MNKSKHYQAISCSMHSELELTIMHGNHLMVDYIEANTGFDEHKIKLKPYDIITRGENEKGEYLLAADQSGRTMEIRLDRIKQFVVIK